MKKRSTTCFSVRAWTRLDLLAFLALIGMLASPRLLAAAQTNGDNAASLPTNSLTPAQQARAFEQATEDIRAECVHGRRIICGRIMKVLSEGLVVDSGYTSLMRPPLNKTWLIPGTVPAVKEANLVEGKEPGCVCVGLVFLTNLPKSRSAKPKPYDYVVIQGYPTGHYTYTSVGTIQRTVRRFSAALANAVTVNRAAAGIKPPQFAPDSK
jgi:hypothetical protein